MDLSNDIYTPSPICNPFGFDFTHSYNGKAVTLKGDGKTYQMVRALRDHMAKHLCSLIENRLHDEEVAKLRDAGNEKAARKYHNPKNVHDTVWAMITGEEARGQVEDVQNQIETANLVQLKETIQAIPVDHSGAGRSVAGLIAHAQEEGAGLLQARVGDGEGSVHNSGSANFGMGAEIPAESVNLASLQPEPAAGPALDVTPIDPAQATAPAADENAFADLEQG